MQGVKGDPPKTKVARKVAASVVRFVTDSSSLD